MKVSLKIRFVMVLLVLLGGVPAVADYDRALDLFQQKKYTESLKHLGEILVVPDDLKDGSPNYQIRFLAAHNHWQLGNTESAVAHFRRCMEIKKDSPDPHIDLSLYMLDLNRPDDAERIARRGLEIAPAPMLYYVMGRVSLARKNYARAKELFEKAIGINPELAYTYHALGVTLMNLGKYREANTAFTIAASMDPGSAAVINNLGYSFEKMGDPRQAAEFYNRARSIDSANRTIQANLERVR